MVRQLPLWKVLVPALAAALAGCGEQKADDTTTTGGAAGLTRVQPVKTVKTERQGGNVQAQFADPLETFNKYDANKDGRLLIEEISEQERIFLGLADRNNDGEITPEELEILFATLEHEAARQEE